MGINRARGALAVCLVALGAAVTLVAGSAVSAGAPAPARTPKSGKPHPRSSPTPTPTPTPTPSPTPTPTRTATAAPRPAATSSPSPAPTPTLSGEGQSSRTSRTSPARAHHEPVIWWDIGPSFGGVYTTATLIDVQHRLERLGAPARVVRGIYAPFIVMGPSEFTDTWGSVRQHTRNRLRPHLGQDVFCTADAPVLAAEPGRVELVSDRLGGTVVRLHHERGGYWYYAHLSGYPEGLASGDNVDTGDVIGYCGTSGNASGTAPHVHFGSYPGPNNPMGDLIDWLATAEMEARRTLDRYEAGPAARGPTAPAAVEQSVCPRGPAAAPTSSALELLLGAGA